MNSPLPPSRDPIQPTQLVMFRFNTWSFYSTTLISFSPTKAGGEYAIIPFVFGVVDKFETDPSKIMMMGNTGDYLFKDKMGNLTVVPNSMGKYYV
jgi:hypothetical protein